MIITYFGSPGAGKTTLAVKLMKKAVKKRPASANFDHSVSGASICDLNGLGSWTFKDGTFLVIDEAGIEYNSRAYKTLSASAIRWFKLHRHFRCDIAVLSQSWDDMDVTIRRLSNELWYIKRVGPWTISRRVYKRITVDKNTEQIIDGYRMASGLWLLFLPLQWIKIVPDHWRLTFRPFYYRYFDSYSKPSGIVVKEFPIVE